jgi:hypothetical protein
MEMLSILGGGAASIVRAKFALLVPQWLDARIVTVEFPADEGTPKMRPLVGSGV